METNKIKFFKVYFRISTNDLNAALPEIIQLLEEAGFEVEHNGPGNCFEATWDKTRLFLGSNNISGPTREDHVELIQRTLTKGKLFKLYGTDIYQELYDFTPEEEYEYYKATYDATIEQILMDAFRTKRRTLYKNSSNVIFRLWEEFRIDTIRKDNGCFDGPCLLYLNNAKKQMISKGLLDECIGQGFYGKIYYCRLVTAKELATKKNMQFKNYEQRQNTQNR